MTHLANWFSPNMLQSLAWALLHFLWQGAALAAMAAVLMSLCRTASSRYAVGVATLFLMLVVPVGTFLFLISPEAPAATSFTVASQVRAQPAVNSQDDAPSSRPLLSSSIASFPWLVEAWLLGVAVFSLRSFGGFVLIERERRKQFRSVSARVRGLCTTLQVKMGIERTVRYCECKCLQTPAVIGWFRPVVLLPLAAIAGLSEEQLASIIAHELAHIRRHDAFVNVFQIGVETLLFYHPAVWWLNKRVRAEREHCCDDIAVSLCGNAIEYARALTLIEEWRTAPALAMAASRGPLTARILRLVRFKSGSNHARRVGLAGGILCLAAALVSGNALLHIAYPKVHATAASAQVSLAQLASPPSAPAQSAPAGNSTSPAKPSGATPKAAAQPAAGGSYIDGLKSAGLDNFTVDQLIAMKIQGVTPEYVRDLHAIGFNPTPDQLVALKIQGVTPEYVRGIKDGGMEPNIDQLIGMKIQGVTPEYVRAIHDEGLRPSGDELISMRIQNVSSEYVHDVHALGVKPTVDQFIGMKIQGVTPGYIRDLQAAGFKFSVDEVIRAKIQHIDKEFIEQAAKHGFQNLTIDRLIQLKNLGVLAPQADI